MNKTDPNIFESAYKYYKWWQDNYSNFRTNILEKLHTSSLDCVNESVKVELAINKEKWHEFTRIKRSRLNKNFTEYINFQLQEKFDVRCALTCRYNQIKTKNSRKKNSPFFRWYYYCKNEHCRKKFSCVIKKEPNTESEALLLLIKYKLGDIHVEKVPIETRCSGEERKRLGAELVASGVINVQSENFLYNQTKPLIGKAKIKNKNIIIALNYFF